MLILVVNSGSSSLKYQVREVSVGTDATETRGGEVLAKGLIENIGTSEIKDHTQALEVLAERLEEQFGDRPLDAAGHRVVHGGERFSEPVLVDDEIIDAIDDLSPLAPLHNPANAMGLRAIHKTWPDLPQVCVFDTAFHRSMPEKAWRYALPESLYTEHGIRRYGFHGTSHDYVSAKAAEFLGVPRAEFNAIVAHLGNGASITAVKNGESVDTSMGYTPLAGLIMGTRSGDLDPSVLTALLSKDPTLTGADLDRMLNKDSGLLGVAGEPDMRGVQTRADAGDERAQLALDMAAYRVAKYIGGYQVAVGGAQALIFTAGIGENSPEFREAVCSQLAVLGVELDLAANKAGLAGVAGSAESPVSDGPGSTAGSAGSAEPGGAGGTGGATGAGGAAGDGDVVVFSTPTSAIKVLVVATDEERAIAEATAELVAGL